MASGCNFDSSPPAAMCLLPECLAHRPAARRKRQTAPGGGMSQSCPAPVRGEQGEGCAEPGCAAVQHPLRRADAMWPVGGCPPFVEQRRTLQNCVYVSVPSGPASACSSLVSLALCGRAGWAGAWGNMAGGGSSSRARRRRERRERRSSGAPPLGIARTAPGLESGNPQRMRLAGRAPSPLEVGTAVVPLAPGARVGASAEGTQS